MINRGCARLYGKRGNGSSITINLYASGKIVSYWYTDRPRKPVYHMYRKILNGLKSNGCAVCGYNRCIAALDFHHVNPQDKKFPIDTVHIGSSNKKLIDELNKCILLCSNCHREIHSKEMII